MPGYLVNGQCIADGPMAMELYASQQFPKFTVTATYAYGHYVTAVTSSAITVQGACSGSCGGIAALSYQLTPTLRACDPLEYPNSIFSMGVTDGAVVGAAVAGVWLTAYAFKAVRRVLGTLGDQGAA